MKEKSRKRTEQPPLDSLERIMTFHPDYQEDETWLLDDSLHDIDLAEVKYDWRIDNNQNVFLSFEPVETIHATYDAFAYKNESTGQTEIIWNKVENNAMRCEHMVDRVDMELKIRLLQIAKNWHLQ
ncbi:hypothetical protein [Vibrio sp. 10N.222.55.C12]|uniref:hypothetical protein n=1 Tax=Vibrio sp. 10N.222.55.C12 TaxID=1884470 RepID=UPI000C8684D2|nr:hypothetical protein [Vibrio sp. 10N.222.55.C12]PMO09842.1 hypothetical protein BCT20_04215 [Vibrio sp. 10N.222.55.C12]